jgi:hypothetical protein
VSAKEEVDGLVGAAAEEFADDLDGENLRIGRLLLGSTLNEKHAH